MTTNETLTAPADSGLESTRPEAKGEPPKILRVPLDSLKPNPINSEIFGESLKDEVALGDLARNIAKHGQHEPIIINPGNSILDGHRRHIALKLCGASFANVVVDYTPRSGKEEEDFILDSYIHKRRASMAERVKIFEHYFASLSRRHGRPRGRPKKIDQNLSTYWDANQIREAAAKAAGFSSRETARQAVAVFKSKRDDLKKGLEEGKLSIDGAHQLLLSGEPHPGPAPSSARVNVACDPFGAAATTPQLPKATPGRLTRAATNPSKPTRRRAAGPSGERSSRSREEVPVASPVVETADDVAPGSTRETEGGVAASSSDAPPKGSAPAGRIDIDASLKLADMYEVASALCSMLRGASDDEDPDFHACFVHLMAMLSDAAGKSCEVKPLAKPPRCARN